MTTTVNLLRINSNLERHGNTEVNSRIWIHAQVPYFTLRLPLFLEKIAMVVLISVLNPTSNVRSSSSMYLGFRVTCKTFTILTYMGIQFLLWMLSHLRLINSDVSRLRMLHRSTDPRSCDRYRGNRNHHRLTQPMFATDQIYGKIIIKKKKIKTLD